MNEEGNVLTRICSSVLMEGEEGTPIQAGQGVPHLSTRGQYLWTGVPLARLDGRTLSTERTFWFK